MRNAQPQPPSDLQKRYNELLYAVERKWEGEDRHETALRYIREAEAGNVEGPCNAQPQPGSGE